MALLFDRVKSSEEIFNINKEDTTGDQGLVFVTFQAIVWTGTSTEQTSSEAGCANMVRRRIIPGSTLKPFADLRSQARKICEAAGEAYLTGFVMTSFKAQEALAALGELQATFIALRDGKFARDYEAHCACRACGQVPAGCSKSVSAPPLGQVLRRISFSYGAFRFEGAAGQVGQQAFLAELTERFATEALETVKAAQESALCSEALLNRADELSRRMAVWGAMRPALALAASRLATQVFASRRLPAIGRASADIVQALQAAALSAEQSSVGPEARQTSATALQGAALVTKNTEPQGAAANPESRETPRESLLRVGLQEKCADGRSTVEFSCNEASGTDFLPDGRSNLRASRASRSSLEAMLRRGGALFF